MTYWCQGKENCTFQSTWLLEDEASNDPGPKSLFYVYNQGKPVKNYLEALQICQRYFDLTIENYLSTSIKDSVQNQCSNLKI